jgi:hypothetical protein
VEREVRGAAQQSAKCTAEGPTSTRQGLDGVHGVSGARSLLRPPGHRRRRAALESKQALCPWNGRAVLASTGFDPGKREKKATKREPKQ